MAVITASETRGDGSLAYSLTYDTETRIVDWTMPNGGQATLSVVRFNGQTRTFTTEETSATIRTNLRLREPVEFEILWVP